MKKIALLFMVILPFTSNVGLAEPTHLGQSPYSHVTLSFEFGPNSTGFCSNNYDFYRLIPNGDRENKPYRVPSGKFLIVTDVTWRARPEPTGFSEGNLVVMALQGYKPNGDATGTLFESTPVLTTASQVLQRLVGGNDTILGGVRVGPWRSLCPTASSKSGYGGALNTVMSAWIHGYEINK